MSVEWITLDTNILVYSIDIDAGFKHERAMEIFWQARQENCVLTLQALAEFFVVVTRKHAMPMEEAVAQIQDWQTLFPIVTATTTSLNAAIRASFNCPTKTAMITLLKCCSTQLIFAQLNWLEELSCSLFASSKRNPLLTF